MRVMRIGHVRMNMGHRSVPVGMAVGADRHRIMKMRVVPIVVRMGVLVFKRNMLVFVGMPLRQMQQHAGQHQRGTRAKPEGNAARVQRQSNAGSDKGREREHRAGTRSTELALRK